jgi:hypothetical protein
MAQHPCNYELVHGGAPELARSNEAPEWYNPAALIENSPPTTKVGGEPPPPRSPRILERVKRNVLWLACIVLLAALVVVAGVLGSRLTSKQRLQLPILTYACLCLPNPFLCLFA